MRDENFAIVSNVQDVKLTSSFITASFILKCTIGVGFLSLPYGYSYCGYVLGLIFFLIFGFATWYCNVSFVECKINLRLSRVSGIGDLGKGGFGIVGEIICNLMMVVDCYGICISYMMFLVRNLELLTGIKPSFLILILIIFLELLSFIRYIKFLGYVSAFVNVVTIACAILLLYSVYNVNDSAGEVLAFNWGSFPIMFGTMCFSYNIVSTTLINHNNMEHPSQYKCVYGIVVIILVAFFALFPLFVYLRLGSKTPGLLTDGISEGYYVMKVVIISMLLLHILVSLIIWLQPLYLFSDFLFHANKYRRVVIDEELARIVREQEELEREQIKIEQKKKNDKFETMMEKQEFIDTTNYEDDSNMEILSPKLGVIITFTESTTHSSLFDKRKTRIERWESNGCYSNDDVIELVVDNCNNINNSNINIGNRSNNNNISIDKSYNTNNNSDNNNNSSPIKQNGNKTNERSFFITSCLSSFCFHSFSCLSNFKKNWKFWLLAAFARLVVLVLAAVPCWFPLYPFFSLYLSLIGCITGSMTGYLIPMLLHLRICWSEISSFRKFLDFLVIVIMAPLMIYITLLIFKKY